MMEDIKIFGTVEEQLSIVNEAIYSVLKGGQSYKIGTRSLTRADLSLLTDMQAKLQSQIAGGKAGALFADTVVAIFEGR